MHLVSVSVLLCHALSLPAKCTLHSVHRSKWMLCRKPHNLPEGKRDRSNYNHPLAIVGSPSLHRTICSPMGAGGHTVTTLYYLDECSDFVYFYLFSFAHAGVLLTSFLLRGQQLVSQWLLIFPYTLLTLTDFPVYKDDGLLNHGRRSLWCSAFIAMLRKGRKRWYGHNEEDAGEGRVFIKVQLCTGCSNLPG